MGVKWTPEQESAIMSPKDSNLGAQTLLVAAAAGSGRAYYYAVKRYGESFIRTRTDGCYIYEGRCR